MRFDFENINLACCNQSIKLTQFGGYGVFKILHDLFVTLSNKSIVAQ